MGIYLPEKVYGCGRMATGLLCCPPHYYDIKEPPASGCSVVRGINADPSAPNHKNYSKEYTRTKTVLVLICRCLGTHSLLKVYTSLKCDV